MVRFVVLLLSVAMLLGCATVRDRAVVAMNGIATFSKGAKETLEDRTVAAAEACLAKPDRASAIMCGQKARRSHAPAWAGYRALRSAWLALAAVINAADLAGTDPGAIEVAKLLNRLRQALDDFRKLEAAMGQP
jgi:hypothetical protein